MGIQKMKFLESVRFAFDTIDRTRAAKLFREHDTDKDGFLSGNQVHIFLKEFMKQTNKDVDVDNFFKDFDINDDIKIGMDEIIGYGAKSSKLGSLVNSKNYPFAYTMTPTHKVRDFIEQFDNFIIDCDGVLWKTGTMLPGAKATLNLLRKAGKKLLFCTNSSTKSRAEYKRKFDKCGIVVDANEIIPSTVATALLLKRRFPQVRKAYVIGTSGLRDELQLVGIEPIAAEPMHTMTEAAFAKYQVDKSITAVVAGFDGSLSYGKICMACLYVEHNKCPMVVTSVDDYDQLTDRRYPAIPIIMKETVERTTGAKVHVAGKPSQFLIDEILKTKGWDPKKTVMIGDRLDSDMLFAGRGGVSKLLVMSGCAQEKDLEHIKAESTECPDLVISHFGLINDAYKTSRL